MEKTVNISRMLLSGALAAAFAATAMPASAHGYRGGHARLGVYFGVPLALPYSYYYPPAYYYGPRVYYPEPLAVAPAAPAYYIQQDNAAANTSSPPGGYWYYCRDPQGYYPQVQQCPTPWQQVPAQPQTR
jgi:hypothetical protein